MSLDFVSNQEIILAARKNLSQNVWDYLTDQLTRAHVCKGDPVTSAHEMSAFVNIPGGRVV